MLKHARVFYSLALFLICLSSGWISAIDLKLSFVDSISRGAIERSWVDTFGADVPLMDTNWKRVDGIKRDLLIKRNGPEK